MCAAIERADLHTQQWTHADQCAHAVTTAGFGGVGGLPVVDWLVAWRLADVLTVALLAEVALLPTIGRLLMASKLGETLRQFGGIERIEWSARWGSASWMLLVAAVCDAAGRLVTR